jgi:hypothetical protein
MVCALMATEDVEDILLGLTPEENKMITINW